MRRRIHACHFYNQHDSLRSLNAHAFDTSNRPGRCASGHQHPSTRGFHLSWFEPLYSSARRRLSSPRRFSSPHPPPAISNFLCMILARTVPNPPQSPIIPLSPLRSNLGWSKRKTDQTLSSANGAKTDQTVRFFVWGRKHFGTVLGSKVGTVLTNSRSRFGKIGSEHIGTRCRPGIRRTPS